MVVDGVNSLNRSKLLMDYKTNKTLNENLNDLLIKSNSKDIVITDMATPDMKYIVLFDELYETKTRTKIGNFWDSIDNIKLFLEHAYSTSTNIPKHIRETFVRDLKSIVINESDQTNDLLILKESLKQMISDGTLKDTANWIWGGVKDVGSYVASSAKQLYTGTTSLVTGAAKGAYQAAGAIMRGDLQKLLSILSKGFLAFGRYIRMAMYNPIGSIIDAILVFTGVGKAAQWIPWAIIVAVDIYEVINDDFEMIPGDSNDWWTTLIRAVAIGFDILGLVTTGAAALAGRQLVKTLRAIPKEEAAAYIAKNPSIQKYAISMLNSTGKVPGFLQKAVDMIKPYLPSVANFISKMLSNVSKLIEMMKNGLLKLTAKKATKIAGRELAVDYGAQKAIETGMSMSQGVAQPNSTTNVEVPKDIPKVDAKTKSFASNIIANY